VAMSLAQHPGGENWAYLIDALRTAEGLMALDILAALATVPQRPSEAAPYRHAILCGLRLGASGGADAAALLAYWHGKKASDAPGAWQAELAQWQQWYAQEFPTAPPAELPADAGRDRWSYDELAAYLDSDASRTGDPVRGAQVFTAAQCAACHRVGTNGETLGPDLSTVAQRFQRKEILESIVYPSHTISDQFVSKEVVANGKTYVGLVAQRGQAGVTVLLPTGQKVEIPQADIDAIQDSTVSAMPTGLLNTLSLEQVADLFAYLHGAQPGAMATRPTTPPK
jgi:putative heme-binding domain-containing protein